MDGNYYLLSVPAQRIADVIGTERTLYLVGQVVPWAGKREADITIPKRPLRDSDRIVQILGRADAEKLRPSLGTGEAIRLTPGKVYQGFRDKSIRRLHREQGIAATTLCEWFELTPRRMRAILGATGSKNPGTGAGA